MKRENIEISIFFFFFFFFLIFSHFFASFILSLLSLRPFKNLLQQQCQYFILSSSTPILLLQTFVSGSVNGVNKEW